MNKKELKDKEVYFRNKDERQKILHEMKNENSHNWSAGDSINELIMGCAYYEDSKNINEYFQLAEEFYNYYDIEKDPWTLTGKRPTVFYSMNKFAFGLFKGEKDKSSISDYVQIINTKYNLKINKSNLVDLEHIVFVYNAASFKSDLAEKILEITDRTLTRAYFDLEQNVNVENLKQYKNAFNKNRNNILFSSLGGYYEIFYYYQKQNIKTNAFLIKEAKLKGLK